MASHQLAIAKASFSAGLLRPDPTSVSRDDIERFHSLLNSVIIQCTPRNIQKCKQWILENVVQSAARCTALGKYLMGLSTSFVGKGQQADTSNREPSSKRKRVHLLYLINDLLHHGKYRNNDASIVGKIQPILVNLVGSAASFKDCPKHQRKVSDLLSIWQEKNYYGKDYIEKLRETVANAQESGTHEESAATGTGNKDIGSSKAAKSVPYIMPAMHGDASTPWFDLPAGNLMPHIVPNSTRPINPDLIRPLQFVSGPAEESLAAAVKALLEDVQSMFGTGPEQDDKAMKDIDELGQPIIVDEITGDVIDGEGYYGWSRVFCEKMKRRKKGIDLPKGDDERGRSRSSSPGRRKRAYSDSEDESSRERYRSRRRRNSGSSRSPTPDGRRRSRSRSRSYSRSPERAAPAPRETGPIPPRQEFPPQPPAQSIPPPPFQQPQGYNQNYPPPPPPPQGMPFNGYGPPPPPPPQSMPYNGQQQQFWQPPPPPIPQMPFNPSNQQYGNQQYGSWPPPPPPPPPPGNPPMQYQQPPGGYPPSGPGGWQGNGRGFNSNGWNGPPRGRGGYRGRGW